MVADDFLDALRSTTTLGSAGLANPFWSETFYIRSATPIAEIRRGCVHTIYIGLEDAASSSRIDWGTCVVFPQAVSPEMMITLLCRMASTIS